MRRISSWIALSTAATALLSGCGGGSTDDGSGNPSLVSYVGTAGAFVAWADPASGTYASAPMGSYAGKRQALRGTVDFMTGAELSQPAGVEVYKGSDGHIYALDLSSTSEPAAQQISSETAATVDDTCSLSGTQVAGANYDYAGVYFAADLRSPTNSSYFYRLPGADGACGTADDIVRMVKTGMSDSDAPITVSDMPIATVRTALGGISGFVVKRGASLVFVDGNFANPIVLGTFAAPIGVASALPVGKVDGYPSGQLYVVDGSIVYVDYAAHTVSAPLLTLPNWKVTSAGAIFAASPSTLYVATNAAATPATPATATIYALPADGSAMPVVVDSEPGHIDNLAFPVNGTNLVWGIANPTYSIRTLPQSGGAATTLVSSPVNVGSFIATATTVYYTTWQGTTDAAAKVVTRSSTASGIVGIDGTVIQAPVANSMFVGGGEQFPWPGDPTVTATSYESILRVQGLSPVTVSNGSTGYTYVTDGVAGGTLMSIDAATNEPIATLGTLPAGSATFLTGTVRDAGHTGFIEAYTPASTNDPGTRDLYLLNVRGANSLVRVTGNL